MVLYELYKRIGNLGTVIIGDAGRCHFYLLHLTVEIVARVRDADYADRGAIPEFGAVKLGNGDVEAGAQAIFQAADDLAPVFDGLRGFDVEFEREESDHSGIRG